jgi:hypothetical protein
MNFPDGFTAKLNVRYRPRPERFQLPNEVEDCVLWVQGCVGKLNENRSVPQFYTECWIFGDSSILNVTDDVSLRKRFLYIDVFNGVD